MRLKDVDIRRARPADVDAIAAAHLDSIRTIGPTFYAPEIVKEWGAGLTGELYAKAMNGGEVFFIAAGMVDGAPGVLGFATHRVDGTHHGTAVYVRGSAARKGIGSALFRLAEAHAAAAGARSIEVDASLAAVDFYKAHGFEETGRGEHPLMSGRLMPCVFME